jgi:hypothetical protein
MRRTHPDNPDTWLETTGPWDIPYRARLLCADGRYRIGLYRSDRRYVVLATGPRQNQGEDHYRVRHHGGLGTVEIQDGAITQLQGTIPPLSVEHTRFKGFGTTTLS